MKRTIYITVHASRRGILRGITDEEIRDVVETGPKRRDPGVGEQGGEMWIYSKRIGRRTIVAVTEVLPERICVITVYPQS